MSDKHERGRTLSVRLPRKLASDLERKANEEANTPSSVARRLISAGLSREQRAAEHDSPTGQQG